MSNLDIDTEKGQKSLNEEMLMLKYISECWNVKIQITKKDTPSVYDGVIMVNDKIAGIFESKNRQMNLYTLEKWGSWLITFEKLENCRLIAKEKKVPFYGFLGIQHSKLVMFWKISDSEGNYLFPFDHHHSLTQATTNGGDAYRDNAYLPIEFGNFIQPNQKFEE